MDGRGLKVDHATQERLAIEAAAGLDEPGIAKQPHLRSDAEMTVHLGVVGEIDNQPGGQGVEIMRVGRESKGQRGLRIRGIGPHIQRRFGSGVDPQGFEIRLKRDMRIGMAVGRPLVPKPREGAASPGTGVKVGLRGVQVHSLEQPVVLEAHPQSILVREVNELAVETIRDA